MNAAIDVLAEQAMLAQQHAVIHCRLDSFSVKMHATIDRSKALGCMMDVLTDMTMHFGFEESLMDAGNCPDFERHRRQHLGMVTELGLLLDQLETLPLTDHHLLRSIDLLADWYRQHAATSDQALLAWLAK